MRVFALIRLGVQSCTFIIRAGLLTREAMRKRALEICLGIIIFHYTKGRSHCRKLLSLQPVLMPLFLFFSPQRTTSSATVG